MDSRPAIDLAARLENTCSVWSLVRAQLVRQAGATHFAGQGLGTGTGMRYAQLATLNNNAAAAPERPVHVRPGPQLHLLVGSSFTEIRVQSVGRCLSCHFRHSSRALTVFVYFPT